jgi:two-component system LytT family sensor kinase
MSEKMTINRNKIIYWFLQFVGWMFYGLLLFLAASNLSSFKWTIAFSLNLLFSVGFGILISHQMRIQVLAKSLVKINQFSTLVKLLLIAAVFSFIYVLTTKLASSFLAFSFSNWDILSLLVNWASVFVVFNFWLALYFIFLLFEETQRKEIHNIILNATQIELELQNLRSQLNPHFLFNSLNSIRALVEVDPKKSKEAINLLSSLLRSSLTVNKSTLVTIEKEMEMVEAYLKLEKIRFEERLEIKIHIAEELLNVNIPAFTIQTLVENAIKHGISKLMHGGVIEINLLKENNQLKLLVSNSGTLGTETDLGIGLSNLKKRLQIQYGSNFKFNLKQMEMVVVEVLISLNS